MPKRKRTGEGGYQINATIERDNAEGGRAYNDTIFYTEHAKDDIDAINQWKSTLSKGVRIVKYTVIFLGLLGLLLACQSLAFSLGL